MVKRWLELRSFFFTVHSSSFGNLSRDSSRMKEKRKSYKSSVIPLNECLMATVNNSQSPFEFSYDLYWTLHGTLTALTSQWSHGDCVCVTVRRAPPPRAAVPDLPETLSQTVTSVTQWQCEDPWCDCQWFSQFSETLHFYNSNGQGVGRAAECRGFPTPARTEEGQKPEGRDQIRSLRCGVIFNLWAILVRLTLISQFVSSDRHSCLMWRHWHVRASHVHRIVRRSDEYGTDFVTHDTHKRLRATERSEFWGRMRGNTVGLLIGRFFQQRCEPHFCPKTFSEHHFTYS